MIRVIREKSSPLNDQAFQTLADACFKTQGITRPLSVCLTLTDETGIQKINCEWRDLDAPTDVLSFPALNLSPDHTLHDQDPQLSFAWDSEENAFFIGDVILCVPIAGKQAKEYGHSLRRELLYLFAHGLFHLMGYDHHREEDKKTMRDKEEQALNLADSNMVSDTALLNAARDARANAYVPYSNYRVGVALLCEDGQVFTGCNIENVSFGLTICAERTAVFKAVSQGCRNFKTIAIAADTTAPWPCGACRQVLAEFAPQLRVLITWGEGKTAQSTLQELLPHSFLHFQEDHISAE